MTCMRKFITLGLIVGALFGTMTGKNLVEAAPTSPSIKYLEAK